VRKLLQRREDLRGSFSAARCLIKILIEADELQILFLVGDILISVVEVEFVRICSSQNRGQVTRVEANC